MNLIRCVIAFLWVVSACVAGPDIEALRKAADQGNAYAQCNLGYAYGRGEGVPQDQAEAVKWFRKAAEQGNAKAQCTLGLAYGRGEGVPKDHEQAVKWFRKAADQGNAYAQFNLGNKYAKGEGVLKDLVEAHAWANIAAIKGDVNSQNLREAIEKEMTKEQIAEATKRAKEILATIQKQ